MESTTQRQQSLKEKIESSTKVEEKLRICLDSMKDIVSSGKTPHFKDFWAAKEECLELFKEKIPSRVRNALWDEYVGLSKEIRQIREVLDEQSAFAKEQIDLALGQLEQELAKGDKSVREQLDLGAKTLSGNLVQYSALHQELSLFNAFGSRVKELRKELVSTQMRMKVKNPLFDRLKSVGDQVFPKRSELVKEISELFEGDVDRFVKEIFSLEEPPFHGLKEEIKALQQASKALGLSPGMFTKTREALSHCWDQIRQNERQYQKNRSEKNRKLKENAKAFEEKVKAFESECAKEGTLLSRMQEEQNTLFTAMKDLELGRDDVKKLNARLKQALDPIVENERELRAAHEQAQAEKKAMFLSKVQTCLDQAEALSHDVLVEKWDAFVKEGKGLELLSVETVALENQLGEIFDHIQEKKWHSIEDVAELKALLDERHSAKRVLKQSLEQDRRTIGGSELSLEEGMIYQEIVSTKKNRLESIETMIEEIEEKLFEIEE